MRINLYDICIHCTYTVRLNEKYDNLKFLVALTILKLFLIHF